MRGDFCRQCHWPLFGSIWLHLTQHLLQDSVLKILGVFNEVHGVSNLAEARVAIQKRNFEVFQTKKIVGYQSGLKYGRAESRENGQGMAMKMINAATM